MSEPTVAGYTSTKVPNLTANLANQKSFVVSGVHDATTSTITTSASITGVTAPLYLVNANTGEIIYAEGISGAQFTTCTRGADGSVASAMNTGQRLHFAPVANVINQIIREVIAIALDAQNAINAERVAMQSHIHDEIMRYIPKQIQYDWDTSHFLRGDGVFAAARTDIPAPNSDTSKFLRGDGGWAIVPTGATLLNEFDVVLYERIFG